MMSRTGSSKRVFKYGKTGNTGMGLYIVSKVIERHHGRIEVKDNDPKGTTFIITIPMNAEPDRKSQSG